MRAYQYDRMLKLSVCAALFMPLAAIAGTLPDASKRLIPMIEADFQKSSSINFYFVSRTGNYVLSDKAIIGAATVRVTRECGNNCASFMKEVTAHLRDARKVPCSVGQENVLILPNRGTGLTFSHSGRVLRYGADCFFTTTGINAVLKRGGFFFE